jgi:F420-dependent oxidoreductase-like protein
MKLGLLLDQVGTAEQLRDLISRAQEAERLGFDSVWVAEAWGTEVVSVLAWVGARTTRIGIGTGVMQIPARTPTAAGGAAAMLDLLSDGRLLLGLGLSGPQVAEGWHGQPWADPLGRLSEYVEIVRAVLRREVVEHHGVHYDIPYAGPGATGLGRALKSIAHPPRADVPIFLATLAPNAVELTGEIADGWLPILCSPEALLDVFLPRLAMGLERGGRSTSDFEIAPVVLTAVGDDVQVCRERLKPLLALHVGGMGARNRNFYRDIVTQLGFGNDAARVQELYLVGRREEAAAAVPNELVDAVSLVGSPARVRTRIAEWAEAGATTLILNTKSVADMRQLADAGLTV